MLHVETIVPGGAGDGSPVAVLLHGRGSNERDLLGLANGLPERTAVVCPRAPHPGGPWGYGPGWAWYRYVAEDRVVSETLDASLAELDALLDGLGTLLPIEPGPLFLGGFSQGGTMSIAYAVTRPGRVVGALNFSGFVVDDPCVALTAEAAARTPIFWGHGVSDPAIPHALAERGRARLAELGAPVASHDYAIGHWIDEGELADARAWMLDVLG